MPGAKGLFGRAIIQSGNTPNVNSTATATRVGRLLAEKLGVPATRAAITAASPELVLQAQAKIRDDLQARPDPAFLGEVTLTYLPWAPTVDGQTIAMSPIEAIAGIKPIRESLYGLTFADEKKRVRWLEDMRGHGERGD